MAGGITLEEGPGRPRCLGPHVFLHPALLRQPRACWGRRAIGYLGLAIGQEEVGSTLVFGRAGAIDKELHVHPLLLLLVYPSDALPKNTALTPGPTPARQACPLGGRV